MIDKIKENSLFILGLMVLVIFLMQFQHCNDSKKMENQAKHFDLSISAINDTLKKTINSQGDTVFTKRVVKYSLKELVNSESFKSLSEANKKFYIELQKVKGIIASSQATINSQAEMIKNLSYKPGTTVTDSTVCFKKNSSETIEDSTSSLHFKHTLTFGNFLKSSMKYTYDAKIQTSFIRNKDKTISVEYKLDDPNANMINGQGFIIPFTERTRFQKFMDNNGKWIRPITYGLTAIAGGYVSYKFTH